MTRSPRLALLTVLLACVPVWANAQVSVGAAATRERLRWHFENPSSYDTPALVPHYFEQDYRLDTVWLTTRASYRAGLDWQTTAAASPRVTRPATDYDTFFNPGDVTWVSGTSGDARVNGVLLSQAVELERIGGVRVSGGYRLRIDRADFLAGDRTDSRNGTVVSRTLVTTREFTTGQQHEVFVAASRDWPLTQRWTARAEADVSPAAINRLSIRLPDKYPGRTLVYRTTAAVTAGRIEISGGHSRWPLTLSLAGSRTWNYSSTQWVRRSALTLGASVGRHW